MMVGTTTPSVVFTPALLSPPRLRLGGDRRTSVNTTLGVIVPTIILMSSQYLYTSTPCRYLHYNSQRIMDRIPNMYLLIQGEQRESISNMFLSNFLFSTKTLHILYIYMIFISCYMHPLSWSKSKSLYWT